MLRKTQLYIGCDIIYLPVSIFDAVDTGLSPVTVLHSQIMVTAPHADPGLCHYPDIQSVDHIAQLPVPGLSFDCRVEIGTVYQHMPGHGLRIVLIPPRAAERARRHTRRQPQEAQLHICPGAFMASSAVTK